MSAEVIGCPDIGTGGEGVEVVLVTVAVVVMSVAATVVMSSPSTRCIAGGVGVAEKEAMIGPGSPEPGLRPFRR
jgi:hypothetical protein